MDKRKDIDHNPDYLNKASRYFPLVGWVVGTVAFGSYCLFEYLISSEIAVLFSMIASILVTGAFHEVRKRHIFYGINVLY